MATHCTLRGLAQPVVAAARHRLPRPHEAGAITIHVYSPPIRAIGHYDLDDGQLRRTPGLPDEPSLHGGVLYAALHPVSQARRPGREYGTYF